MISGHRDRGDREVRTRRGRRIVDQGLVIVHSNWYDVDLVFNDVSRWNHRFGEEGNWYGGGVWAVKGIGGCG